MLVLYLKREEKMNKKMERKQNIEKRYNNTPGNP